MIYDKLPIVFLSTLVSDKKDSTNSQIATYILEHKDNLQNIGIKQMASECHVAMSSISRFCKEIGLQDYNELRELLVSTYYHFQQVLSLQDYKIQLIENIEKCDQSLDLKKMEMLVEDIKQYQKVGIFGLLKAESVAINLQCDLLMLGKQITTKLAYNEQMDYLQNIDQEDLVIIFSYTGTYFDPNDLRRLHKQLKKAKVWMITGKNVNNPYIDQQITFDSSLDQLSHPYTLQYIASLLAQMYAKNL